MVKDVAYYIDLFGKMNRSAMRGFKAPHKPILLLSVMDLIQFGIITENHFQLSSDIVNTFAEKWKKYVDDGSSSIVYIANDLSVQTNSRYPFKCAVETPFYHMNSEPFWRLEKSKDYISRSTYSISMLRKCFSFTEIDKELYNLIKDPVAEKMLRTYLLSLLSQ